MANHCKHLWAGASGNAFKPWQGTWKRAADDLRARTQRLAATNSRQAHVYLVRDAAAPRCAARLVQLWQEPQAATADAGTPA